MPLKCRITKNNSTDELVDAHGEGTHFREREQRTVACTETTVFRAVHTLRTHATCAIGGYGITSVRGDHHVLLTVTYYRVQGLFESFKIIPNR